MINGKSYIGQSIDPHHRFIEHLSHANTNDDNSPLHFAIAKYGKDNFKFEILEWSEDYNKREQELIRQFNTLAPNGYNIALGGEDPPHYFGEQHPRSKISDDDVDQIIDLLKHSQLTEPQIGASFNPPYNQIMINSINHGNTHRRPNEHYPIRTEHPYHLSKEQREEIIWLLQNTLYPVSQIAQYYHVNSTAIKHINVGRNYFNADYDYPLRKTRGKWQSEPVETILAKRSTSAIDTPMEMGIRQST